MVVWVIFGVSSSSFLEEEGSLFLWGAFNKWLLNGINQQQAHQKTQVDEM